MGNGGRSSLQSHIYLIKEEVKPKNGVAFVYDNGLSLAGNVNEEVGDEDSTLVVEKDKKDIRRMIAVTCKTV